MFTSFFHSEILGAPRAISPRRCFILSRVLKPDMLEEAFQNRLKTELFFVLVNDCRMDSKVFIILEYRAKSVGNRNLGHSIEVNANRFPCNNVLS